MREILSFWHYMFSPVGAPWFSGAFWSNQTQWTVVWLPTLIVLYRKKWECSEKGCWRLGHFPVKGTHHRTCHKHTNTKVHNKLQLNYRSKHPETYKFLKGAKNGSQRTQQRNKKR